MNFIYSKKITLAIAWILVFITIISNVILSYANTQYFVWEDKDAGITTYENGEQVQNEIDNLENRDVNEHINLALYDYHITNDGIPYRKPDARIKIASYSNAIASPSESYAIATVSNARLEDYPIGMSEDGSYGVPEAPEKDVNKGTKGIFHFVATPNFQSNKNEETRPFNNWYSGDDSAMQGIVKPKLTEEGFPEFHDKIIELQEKSTNQGEVNKDLKYLYDDEKGYAKAYEGLTGLFEKDEDGYYEFNSAKHFVSIIDINNPDNKQFAKFNVDEIKNNVRPVQKDARFLPFNTLDKNKELHLGINPRPSEEKADAFFINYSFGMHMDFEFYQPSNGTVNNKSMIFEFNGDDDIWVFIDDVLVLDLGGNHSPANGLINFETGKIEIKNASGNIKVADRSYKKQYLTLGEIMEEIKGEEWVKENMHPISGFSEGDYANYIFNDYTNHTFDLFYLERGAHGSNCAMKFNLRTIPNDTIQIGKQIKDNSNNNDNFSDAEFTIKAEIGDTEDNLIPYVGRYDLYELVNDEEILIEQNLNTNNDGTFILKNNQFVRLKDNIQLDTYFRVTELDAEEYGNDYTFKLNTPNLIDTDSTLSENEMGKSKILQVHKNRMIWITNEFKNLNPYPLIIQKELNDEEQSSEEFYISIKNGNGTNYIGNYYIREKDSNTELKNPYTTNNGMIRLRPNQEAVMTDLALGSKVLIKEINLDEELYNKPIYSSKNVIELEETENGYLCQIKANEIDNDATVKIINTKKEKKGSITIHKTVAGEVENFNKEFDFKVTLTAPDGQMINGTYGELEFKNGIAEFKLSNNESILIPDIKEGIKYKVEELESQYYSVSVNGKEEGIIAEDDNIQIEFLNTLNTGNIAITKEISSPEFIIETPFQFHISLDSEAFILNGTYSGIDFTNNEADFTLKAGETKEISGLPVGMEYSITEINTEEYVIQKINDTGIIKKDTTANVLFTNIPNVGSLSIQKIVNGQKEEGKEFRFIITLSNPNGKIINGTYGDITFINNQAEFTLSDNEIKHVFHLPAGTTYLIEEIQDDKYSIEKTNHEGVITIGEVSEAIFTNTTKTGNLSITKNISEEDILNASQEFQFNITFKNESSSNFNLSGTYGDITLQNNIGTFTLTPNETKTITGIPIGMKYEVEEINQENYISSSKNSTGVIEENKTISSVFTNILKRGNLLIRKNVNGYSKKDEVFNFTVTFSNDKNLGNYTLNGTYGDITLKNNVGEFSLEKNEFILIEDIPMGMKYQVTEVSNDKYITTLSNTEGNIEYNNSLEAVITNTRKTGTLTILKNITGIEYESGKDFDFKLTLTDEDGNIQTDNFTLKNGESKFYTQIPYGWTYLVEELVDNTYTSVGNNNNGIISNELINVSFTNTMNLGSLSITKNISGKEFEPEKEFNFIINLVNAPGKNYNLNGTYGDVTVVNNQGSFTLKNNETKTITGIPVGMTYEIIENNSNYNISSSNHTGVIEKDTTKNVSFTNEMKVGNLQIEKEVIAPQSDEETHTPFQFKITLTNDKNTNIILNGTYGDLVFNNNISTFELKDGESVLISGIPVNMNYLVEEMKNDSFITTSINASGIVEENNTIPIKFTNTVKTGDLTIVKEVNGETYDKNKEFNFTITLQNNLNEEQYNLNGTYGDITFTNNTANFSLKDQESISISNIPNGMTYIISEEEDSYYTVNESVKTGTIETGISKSEVFINTLKRGSISIEKNIAGEHLEPEKLFTFNITLTDPNYILNGTYGDVNFKQNKAEVKLRAGEKVKINNIPIGMTYKVEENTYENYSTRSENATGTIIENENIEINVINTLKTGNIKIKKVVLNAPSIDQEFLFELTLTNPNPEKQEYILNGTYGDFEFKNNKAIITLKNNQIKTAVGIPIGMDYEIIELNNDDYTVSAIGNTGTVIQKEDSEQMDALFVNTFKTQNIQIIKKFNNAESDTQDEYWFTLTLKNDDSHNYNLNGTYGDLEFKDNVARFSLSKENSRKEALRIPAGMKYEINEDVYNNYETTYINKEGIINKDIQIIINNTLKTGEISIIKEFKNATPDINKEYWFTLTLKNNDLYNYNLNGIYGDLEFKDNVARFSLTQTNPSKKAILIPLGMNYELTEDKYPEYNITYLNNTGTINSSQKIKILNELKTGDIEINKEVIGKAVNPNEEFRFKIRLTNQDNYTYNILGTFGDVEFKDNNIAEFSLKAGETKVIKNIPLGMNYEITEIVNDDYISSSENNIGVVKDISKVNFKNVLKVGQLTIKKEIDSPIEIKDDEFTFDILFTDPSEKYVLNGDYGIELKDNKGSFTLKAGEKVIISEIPKDMKFEIKEREHKEYEKIETIKGTIKEDIESKITVINKLRTGDLDIKVTVSGNAGLRTKQFTVTIYANDRNGDPLIGTYGDVIFFNGVAEFKMKHDDIVSVLDLPVGTTYKIIETDNEGYTVVEENSIGTSNEEKIHVIFDNFRENRPDKDFTPGKDDPWEAPEPEEKQDDTITIIETGKTPEPVEQPQPAISDSANGKDLYENKPNEKLPKAGDKFNFIFYISLNIISLGTILYFYRKRKKR